MHGTLKFVCPSVFARKSNRECWPGQSPVSVVKPLSIGELLHGIIPLAVAARTYWSRPSQVHQRGTESIFSTPRALLLLSALPLASLNTRVARTVPLADLRQRLVAQGTGVFEGQI
jgi:hypothetical protein